MRKALALLLLAGCATPPPPRHTEPAEPTRETAASPREERDETEADLPRREEGRRTSKVTNRVIRVHRAKFRACYDQASQNTPDLRGKVELTFTILPDGAVKSARVDEGRSDIRDEGMAACLVKVVQAIRFPAASEEVGSTMHYPFDFKPGGAR